MPDEIAISLAELLCEDNGSEEGRSDEDDYEEDQFHKHIDCEQSALGNWESSRKNEPKPAKKEPPRRPILIDPLPMKPAVKKKGN